MKKAEQVAQNKALSPAQVIGLLAGTPVPVNKDIRNYVYGRGGKESPEAESWASKPEIPSSDEILGLDSSEDVELLPNQITGPWPSKHSYLKAHYDLLREDAVAPLRDAVAYFREEPEMMDGQSVSIYEKVRWLAHATCSLLTSSRFISSASLLLREVSPFGYASQLRGRGRTLFGTTPRG